MIVILVVRVSQTGGEKSTYFGDTINWKKVENNDRYSEANLFEIFWTILLNTATMTSSPTIPSGMCHLKFPDFENT